MEESAFAFIVAFCILLGTLFYNVGRWSLQDDFKAGKCFAVGGEIACK